MTFSETVDSGRTRRGRQHCVCDMALKWARSKLKNATFQGLNCPNSEASGKSRFSSLVTLFHFNQLQSPKCRSALIRN